MFALADDALAPQALEKLEEAGLLRLQTLMDKSGTGMYYQAISGGFW